IWDYYLWYPAILTNTLVPQPSLSSILQNQLGVALDALTIFPFLVIDDKLVEVFNGDKNMCKLKNAVIGLMKMMTCTMRNGHLQYAEFIIAINDSIKSGRRPSRFKGYNSKPTAQE